jgi:hypothetical protein
VTATPDSTKTDDKLSCDDDENDEINITDETNDNDAKEVTDELLPTKSDDSSTVQQVGHSSEEPDLPVKVR